jgi:hypothetical protein
MIRIGVEKLKSGKVEKKCGRWRGVKGITPDSGDWQTHIFAGK